MTSQSAETIAPAATIASMSTAQTAMSLMAMAMHMAAAALPNCDAAPAGNVTMPPALNVPQQLGQAAEQQQDAQQQQHQQEEQPAVVAEHHDDAAASAPATPQAPSKSDVSRSTVGPTDAACSGSSSRYYTTGQLTGHFCEGENAAPWLDVFILFLTKKHGMADMVGSATGADLLKCGWRVARHDNTQWYHHAVLGADKWYSNPVAQLQQLADDKEAINRMFVEPNEVCDGSYCSLTIDACVVV